MQAEMESIIILSLMLILGFGIVYWYIALPLLFMSLCFGLFNEIILKPRKIKKIKSSDLVLIKGSDNQYGIPVKIGKPSNAVNSASLKQSQFQLIGYKVFIMVPILQNDGSVEFKCSYHALDRVEIAKLNVIQEDRKLTPLKKIAPIIKEYVAVETEISHLKNKKMELIEVKKLISLSDIYHNQESIYERALLQIENIINKAEELKQVYLHLIKECLISYKVAEYNLDSIPDNIQLSLDLRYRHTKEEYQKMKDTADAYFVLVRDKRINKLI